MMHVHGIRGQELSARSAGVALERLVAAPVDVGKGSALAMVCDFAGRRLAAPSGFRQDRAGVAEFVARVESVLPAEAVLVRVGVEACGHHHRPLIASDMLPADWQVVELNLAWVTAQRRVNGSARRKTDPIDLAAIADLLLAGRGYEVAVGDEALVALTGWVAHRGLRVYARSGLKNQLLAQVDRSFPGLAGCLSDVLRTKVGRLAEAARSWGLAVSSCSSPTACLAFCSPDDAEVPVEEHLLQPQRGIYRVEWPGDPAVEFHLSHGEWIRPLHQDGFEVLDLVELYAPADAEGLNFFVDAEWAKRWPGEGVWKARKR